MSDFLKAISITQMLDDSMAKWNRATDLYRQDFFTATRVEHTVPAPVEQAPPPVAAMQPPAGAAAHNPNFVGPIHPGHAAGVAVAALPANNGANPQVDAHADLRNYWEGAPGDFMPGFSVKWPPTEEFDERVPQIRIIVRLFDRLNSNNRFRSNEAYHRLQDLHWEFSQNPNEFKQATNFCDLIKPKVSEASFTNCNQSSIEKKCDEFSKNKIQNLGYFYALILHEEPDTERATDAQTLQTALSSASIIGGIRVNPSSQIFNLQVLHLGVSYTGMPHEKISWLHANPTDVDISTMWRKLLFIKDKTLCEHISGDYEKLYKVLSSFDTTSARALFTYQSNQKGFTAQSMCQEVKTTSSDITNTNVAIMIKCSPALNSGLQERFNQVVASNPSKSNILLQMGRAVAVLTNRNKHDGIAFWPATTVEKLLNFSIGFKTQTDSEPDPSTFISDILQMQKAMYNAPTTHSKAISTSAALELFVEILGETMQDDITAAMNTIRYAIRDNEHSPILQFIDKNANTTDRLSMKAVKLLNVAVNKKEFTSTASACKVLAGEDFTPNNNIVLTMYQYKEPAPPPPTPKGKGGKGGKGIEGRNNGNPDKNSDETKSKGTINKKDNLDYSEENLCHQAKNGRNKNPPVLYSCTFPNCRYNHSDRAFSTIVTVTKDNKGKGKRTRTPAGDDKELPKTKEEKKGDEKEKA